MASTISSKLLSSNERPSGFDYMRIILAFSVIFVHSFEYNYNDAGIAALMMTPLWPFVMVIVPMFFCLSGFLVTGSMYRCKTLVTFMGLRVIRIYPALTVEVLLSAILIGPLVSTLPAREYFHDPLFFTYLVNITGHISYYLPGVFSDNPYPGIVNSQLWTVPYELYCYITLGLLIALGVKKWRSLTLAALALLMSANFIRDVMHKYDIQSDLNSLLQHGPFLVMFFVAGVGVYQFREKVPYSLTLFLVCLVLTPVLLALPYRGGAVYLCYYSNLYNRLSRCFQSGAWEVREAGRLFLRDISLWWRHSANDRPCAATVA